MQKIIQLQINKHINNNIKGKQKANNQMNEN